MRISSLKVFQLSVADGPARPLIDYDEMILTQRDRQVTRDWNVYLHPGFSLFILTDPPPQPPLTHPLPQLHLLPVFETQKRIH